MHSRKINSLLLAMMLVLVIFTGLFAYHSANLVITADAEKTRVFAGGNGSVEDPFQISNVDQLQDMNLNLSANYVLINDIDASITVKWNSGEGFNPVGESGIDNWFRGTLNGQGYNIIGLYINRTTSFVGLFGFNGGGLNNTGLIDIDITGVGGVGGLVGVSAEEISNCFTTGTVFGTGNAVGGLAGSTSGALSNCYSSVDVSGVNSVGGLAGSTSDVSNCYSTGNVSGSSMVGGLVGDTDSLISDCYSTGDVSGNSMVGGLVGFSMGSVENSFWDTETSGMATSSGGTGKTTAEMMTREIFTSAGWDLSTVWNIINNVSYPFLLDFYHAPSVYLPDGEAVEVDEDSYFTSTFEIDIPTIPSQNSLQSRSFDTNASWLTWDAENNTIYGTPTNDDVGSYFMDLTVDDLVSSTSENITITVLNSNDAPDIDLTYTNATEDVIYSIVLSAVDVDPTGDILTWTLESGPEWLELNTTTNTLIGTPLNSDVGSHSVNISVNDGQGGSDWENITIFVENVNDAPIILTAPLETTLQDEHYSLSLNATDEDPVELNLTWSVNTDAEWLELNGTYLNGTPGNSDVGMFWVNLTVMDGYGDSNSVNFTLVVVNVNDAPVWTLVPGDQNMTEGEALFLDCMATDMDGDNVTYSISSNPVSDLTINPITGSIRWGSLVIGTYAVTLTATDGILEVQYLFSIFVNASDEGSGPDDNQTVPTNDTDGDGMPDAWEEEYGLDPGNASDATLDPDGDGISNFEEYKNGSDPTIDEGSSGPITDDDDAEDKEEKGSDIGIYLAVCLILLLIIVIIVVIAVRSKKVPSDQLEE